jgi:hypothetical protein
LKRLPDRSFAVYYANDCGLERRRFTVGHELAHLVLDQFHPHVESDLSNSDDYDYRREVERAVDRIAAELLMPAALVTGLMKTQCKLQREQSASGLVQKRMVVEAVGQCLGVSELALVHRLLELPELLSVLLRVQWNDTGRPERSPLVRELFSGGNRPPKPCYFPAAYTQHSGLRIVEGLYPDPSDLEFEDGWEHQVHVQTRWGRRLIRCHAWRRPAKYTEKGNVETWILGWAWNAIPPPAWDDSEHKVAHLMSLGVREFEARRGPCATPCRGRRSSTSPARRSR